MDVTTPDGRTLAVSEDGNPAGTPVFVHHGTPGCADFNRETVASAHSHGLRLIAWDRSGYAGSSPHPGRTVASAAADAATVADALGIDRFLTWGHSGGGPHALACAALLPERVPAAAALASVAPFDALGDDWVEGMGQDNLDEFAAARAGEATLRAYLEPARAELLAAVAADVDAVVDQMASLLPDVDAVWARAHPEALESFSRALAPGIEGWLADDLSFAQAWGFDLADISIPVLVVQGDLDLMVPKAHGTYLGRAIPGADVRELTGAGHLTLATRIDDIHEWLLERWA